MSGPLYPSQQLRSVSLETFFAGRFSALSRLELVQEEFESELRHLFVPNALPSQPLALQPFHLRSKELGGGEDLAIAINQASFISFEYPGYQAFAPRALDTLKRSYSLLGIKDLMRVTYRYENLIAMGRREDGTLIVDQILNPGVPSACTPPASLQAINNSWKARWDQGSIEIAMRTEQDGGLDALRLTIAATVAPAGPVSELPNFAASAHTRASECFESLITPWFREMLAGDTEGQ